MKEKKEIAIKVKGLGKKYIIGKKKDGSLRGSLANVFKSQSRKGVDFWALRDLNFEIVQGDIVGVIGRNGAGKSTLLKVLSKITKPTEGRIELDGRVASLLEVGTGFHPELTGRENIFLNGTILGMTRKEVAEKFDEIVEFSGVRKFIDTPVKRYSSGQYVRLAFAVAAHLEPEILIIDEVLAVGDAEFQKKCLGKMKNIAGEGRTVIFVSHDIGAVKNLCNKGIHLENGEIKYIGDIDQTISNYTQSFDANTLLFDVSDYSARPRGNKFAVIEKIRVNQRFFSPADTLEVDVFFRCLEESSLGKVIHIAVFISDQLNSCLYHLNSASVGYNKVFEKENKATFVIDSLHLARGTYSLNVHLSSSQVEYDYIENVVGFEVDSRTIYPENSIFVGKIFKPFKIV